ncbi:MAG TPA: 1-acyl-sn-glycerol-3-phosphate acyltransferase [Planctomycetaceae bacterium]|nr:1-acyl-sn-glycerol-3-phosphate acyltransferase [Planctomycetaceae bacterium]
MHKVIVEEPYKFVPPFRGKWLSWMFRLWLKPYLRKNYGIVKCTYEGLEHVRESIKAGHGILLCPNHSRDSDPMLIGMLCRAIPSHVFSMASWHIFKQSWLESFVVRRLGGFSVYREGMDRQALDTSVKIVVDAERPLVIFPEGVISRTNDRLNALMDGVSFIARVAAKKRAEISPDKKVVIHPIGIRYRLLTDLATVADPILTKLEERTFWKTQEHLSTLDRIARLAMALLAAREIEVLGVTQSGTVRGRIASLINSLLHPIEKQWLGAARLGDVIVRVKDLRSAILPEMLKGTLTSEERTSCWRQLTDCYYAQTLSMYPEGYLDDGPKGKLTPERIMETIQRLEEDLTDRVTAQPVWKVEFRIGEAMVIDPTQKKVRGTDPVSQTLRDHMLSLLEIEDWWPPQPVTTVEV